LKAGILLKDRRWKCGDRIIAEVEFLELVEPTKERFTHAGG
jgi:hypothetical protein